MSTFDVMGDYHHETPFYHDGDVMIAGTFKADQSVAITGTLMVLKDIDIAGDCEVGELLCSRNIDIAGFLDCDKIHCGGSIKVGYGLCF